jgi:hypothetical protein
MPAQGDSAVLALARLSSDERYALKESLTSLLRALPKQHRT